MALLAALVASGAAGLIYQICWIRSATLTVGSTTQALGIVLAAFFGGLAAGSALFGRMALRQPRPLRMYATLELGIAALGLASIVFFGLVDAVLVQVARAAGDGVVTMIAEVVLIALILTPPAVLMGGTLPLLCRHVVGEDARLVADVSRVYAINTLGAAAGCALAGLYLIPVIGMRWSIALAAALNVAAAAIALRMDGGVAEKRRPLTRPSAGTFEPSRAAVLMAAIFFLTGAAALANEVLWTRFAALLVASTVTTYTITIGIVLLGIALGSLAIAGARASASAAFVFGGLQALLAVWVLGVMHLPPPLWESLGARVWMYVLLFLPPSILSGASFPLAVRVATSHVELAARSVGALSAANLAGGIAGAIGAAYLLPGLGLEMSVRLTTALSLLAAWVAWLALDRGERRQNLRMALAVVAAVAWVGIARLAPTRIPEDFLTRNGVLIDVREGKHSNLAVSRADGVTLLTSDHWWQGQDAKSHQIMAAHVPMLLHPSPGSVLVIGVGAGQTPARFTMYDVARIDAVDIDPVVFDVVREHFDAAWMDDPRVRLRADDGRTVIQRTAERYDVISIEIGQLLRPGAGMFYTREFYERVRDRLEEGGLVSQFVPVSFLTPDEFRNVVRTFVEVFPQALLWFNRTEPLLIGTTGPRLAIEPARLQLLEQPGAVHDDLRFAVWGGEAQWQNQPHMFLAGFLTGAAGVQALGRGGDVYSDDRPVLDYRAGRVLPPEESEYPIFEQILQAIEPIAIVAPEVDTETVAGANAARAQLLDERYLRGRLRQRLGGR